MHTFTGQRGRGALYIGFQLRARLGLIRDAFRPGFSLESAPDSAGVFGRNSEVFSLQIREGFSLAIPRLFRLHFQPKLGGNFRPFSAPFWDQIQTDFQAIFRAILQPNSKLKSRQKSTKFQTSNIMYATLFKTILWIFLVILICKLPFRRNARNRRAARPT